MFRISRSLPSGAKSAARWALLCTGAVFLLSSAVSPTALALVSPMTVAELTDESKTILIGRVVGTQSEWNDDRNFIWTEVTIHVERFLKNDAHDGAELSLRVPWGEVDGLRQFASDACEFNVGEQVVCFLGDKDQFMRLQGWRQGKFTVEKGSVVEADGVPLADFVEKIQQGLSGSGRTVNRGAEIQLQEH